MNGKLKDYQKIFDCIEAPICVLSPDGLIITCNNAMSHLLGYSREDLTGKSVLVVHPPGTEMQVASTLDSLKSSDDVMCHVPLVDADGTEIPVKTHIYKGTWEGKTVFFGFSQDISKQVEIEKKFQTIFYSAPVPMMISGIEDGVILEVNPAWLQTMGFEGKDIMGMSVMDLGAYLDKDKRGRLVEKFISQGFLADEWVEFKRVDGTHVYGRLSATPLLIDNKKYWVTCFLDRTKQHTLEQELFAVRELAISKAMTSISSQLSQNKFITHG